MISTLMKAVALRGVALGIKAPEAQIDRFVEMCHLRRLLSILDINCVLDVGANRGQFAEELRSIGYAGRIVSFEPLPQEFAHLSGRFAHDDNWKGFQLALGSEDRTMNINVQRLSVLSSLLDPIEEGASVASHEVSVRRLDALFPSLVVGIEPRVFLKMDTQGYDVEVFNGASGCLGSVHGLQSELSVRPIYLGMPHYVQALEIYERAGFDLYNLSVVSRGGDGGLVEMNCFMSRRP